MRSVSLPFRKITHQMMWDLYCLDVIHSRMHRDIQEFENPGSEKRRVAQVDGTQANSDLLLFRAEKKVNICKIRQRP